MIRIAVDDSAAFNQGAGIGRYARNVVPAMAGELPDAVLSLLYAPEPVKGASFADAALAPFPGHAKPVTRSTRLDRRRMDQIWFRARLPIPVQLWTGRQDLVYSPDFTAPPALRTPRVVTIHDLAFQIVPERAPLALRRYLDAVVPRMVREAAAVVAVSETTKRDMIQRLGIAPDKITVVTNAVDERFFSAQPLSATVRSRLGLPGEYLLSVGTIEPRKNHASLFRAIEMIPAGAPPLVIAGRPGWDSDGVMDAAQRLVRTGRAILLDYVDDRDLPGLYAGAAALIYPSWYEGFGLPVLEGLAAGIPVIASDVPAHREVGGDVVTFVQPADIDALAGAISEGFGNDPATIELRKEQARGYSWAQSGRILANLLRTVANR